MFDLFINELKRYRKVAILGFLAHMIVWAVMTKIFPALAPHTIKFLVLVGLAVLAGTALGVVANSLIRRKNHWTYLVHRPISTGNIHLAISGAHVMALILVVALPIFLIFGFYDVFTTSVVDARYYWTVVHLTCIALTGYFLGSYGVFSPAKASFAALWLMFYVTHETPLPLEIELSVDLFFVISSFALSRYCFKVNPENVRQTSVFTVASVLALQPALLIVLLMIQGTLYHTGLAIFSTHPSKNFELNSYQNFRSKDLPDAFGQLLEQSTNPKATTIAQELALSKYNFTRKHTFNAPTRQQLFFKEKPQRYAMVDETNNRLWVFSHKDMVFVGRNSQADTIEKYIGANGFFNPEKTVKASDKFTQVPAILSNKFIQSADTIYTIDFEHEKVVTKFELPANEVFVKNMKTMFDKVVIQSNKATYFFDTIDFNLSSKTIVPEHVIQHPNDLMRYEQVVISEVMSGYILGYFDNHYFGYNQPGASVIFADRDEKSGEPLVEYAFTEPHVAMPITYQSWLLSPIVMNVFAGIFTSNLHVQGEPYAPYQFFWQRDIPSSVQTLAICLLLASALLSFIVARHFQLSSKQQTLWAILGLTCGIPGLLALMLLNWNASKHMILSFVPANKSSQRHQMVTKEHANV